MHHPALACLFTPDSIFQVLVASGRNLTDCTATDWAGTHESCAVAGTPGQEVYECRICLRRCLAEDLESHGICGQGAEEGGAMFAGTVLLEPRAVLACLAAQAPVRGA